MTDLLLPAAIVLGIVVMTPVATRLRVPQPILLLVYGLVLALVPGVPDLRDLDAELILPVVLPPLLFAATQRSTVGQFRESAGSILLLAVGLTVATAVVVTLVAHAVGLSWTAAFVLGAVVSPPDPVAATAVARRLRLPERLVTVLEGEGMFNDATALVLYKVAVAAALTGEFAATDAVVVLVLAVVVGIAVGLALGWLSKVALAALHDAGPETTVTIAAPFAAYLVAEHFEGSGVLAVLALGLFLRSYAHPALTSQGWLLGRSVWDYADFLITGVVFVLVGFELTNVIGRSATDADTLVLAVVVLLTVVLLRPSWLFPAVVVARAVHRRRSPTDDVPVGWRETAVASWAGMRGVVTVATALALPSVADDGTPLRWREGVLLVALVVVLATLVVQGLTLTPLVQRLGVGTVSEDARQAARLRVLAMRTAVEALSDEADPALDDTARQAALAQYEGRLHANELMEKTLHGDAEADPDAVQQSDRLAAEVVRTLRHASDVEREVVLRARRSGEVSPAAADEVLDEIEIRAARLAP